MESIITRLNIDTFTTVESLSIKQLEDIIKYSAKKYYYEEPVISDTIYDILIDFLRLKDKNNKLLKQVGAPIKSKDKVELPYYLGSMDKIKPENGEKILDKWKKKYKQPYILSDKLDGISALIVYNFDDTIKMYTRGEATNGFNITLLLKYFKKIPSIGDVKEIFKKKKYKEQRSYLALRGELIIPDLIFKKNWSKEKSNARNTVGGLVNSVKSGKINPKLAKDTRFVCYQVIDPILNITEQYNIMKELGLYIVHNRRGKDINFKSLSKYLIKRKTKSKYKIDGIIVTNNDLHPMNEDNNPEYAFAFKDILEDQKAVTVIKKIEWNVSKDGYIKPTIIIKPVKIGVNIQRLTGNNARFIKNNKLSKGAIIEIIRSGDVIPKLFRVIKPATKINFPDIEYNWDNNNVEIIIKKSDSREMNIKNIYYFFSQLNIKGMGEKVVEKLYDAGHNSVIKILKMKKDNLLKIDSFKEKSANNLIKAILKSVTNITLPQLMNASNVLGRGMGIERMKSIVSTYPNILKNKWNTSDLIDNIKKIDGWDDITATLFANNYLRFLKYYNDIKKYITIKEKKIKINGKYKNKKIVISGFRDKELIEYIEKEGGIITNTVSKNTDILIIKDSSVMNTSKVLKAQNFGINIILKKNLNKI
jgi:NAD-dependent DNA ligase